MNTRKNPVCVVGLGTVGLPTAAYLQSVGYDVFGYDISPRALERAKTQIRVGDFSEIPSDSKIFVICVSTTCVEDKPVVTNVYDACSKVADGFDPRLVVIESTVPVGTCRDIYQSILDSRVNLAHVPHRYWPEDPLRHGVPQLRVAGAVNVESSIITRDFYADAGIPVFQVDPIEIAEMSKIVENAYRYVQIAFTEELKLICDRNNINFRTLRHACNTKWNVELPEARTGIGGTCLPKDIRYLIHAARSKGLQPDILLSAIQANKKYVEQLVQPLCYT
ncbi:hypothetical protein KEJ39_06680 [Candidatus Bathyarchaeota archaeon]|nr:hypothetical protein [Candidatus Bathyarchaeota archaeon]